MTPPLQFEVEGQLRFTFQRPAWEVVRWDEEPAYIDGLQRHGGKAVDLVATLDRRCLYLIEVKDPRGYWGQYRQGTPLDDLAQIVADKIRDTIAGLVFARDRHVCEHLAIHLKTLFGARAERPILVLWLETIQLDAPLALTLKGKIESRVRWLAPKVIVTSRRLWQSSPSLRGLDVESLPDAPARG